MGIFRQLLYYRARLFVYPGAFFPNDNNNDDSGLRIDSQTVLDHVLADPTRNQKPIAIFGQSLGGAVAIDLTSRNDDKVGRNECTTSSSDNAAQIAALIVENTFTSIPDIMKNWGLIGHFSFLCSEKWWSATRMARMSARIPVLLLSATEDTIIPPSQMERLRHIANERGRKPSKKTPLVPEEDRGQVRLELLEKCGHNTSLDHPKYWHFVEEFVKSSLKHWDATNQSFADSK
ncbi:hypothetical protein CVT24_006029 [Panaeolus cyanescens]|uniref:Serine aminopeptidase S33 domain-containing protein n=1 Tax=Panaeolus cyanescens TaxID=181874 RepID=A0A409YE46_9AGAR|nr:hypothetical protein CVT24_006029 [Panaeolus cyanescens]